MDRVRFGRALGYGARHAAKSLMKAADAAAATNPSRPGDQPPRAASRVVETWRTVGATKTHARALGKSVWAPVARFSSVVWLQVTGVFFTLLAMFLSQGLWKQRALARQPLGSHAAEMFYIHAAAFAVFAYFAISNFVRAHLRERR